MKKKLIPWIKICAGAVFVAGGIYFFLAPAQLASGGISGLSIILQSFFPQIPISAFVFFLDMLLFITGTLILGVSFGIKSVTASLSIAAALRVFEVFFPSPPLPSHDVLVVLIFGSLLIAFGQALLFNQNASSGGTDIIAKIISKWTHLKIAHSLLFADMGVVIIAVGSFGVEKGLYAALGVLISTALIDYFISGFTVEKYVVIIPSDDEKARRANDFILYKLGRGATTYEGHGAFSGSRKTVITTVVGIRDFVRLKQFLADYDRAAFITVQNLHEVMGEGFERKP